MPKILDLDSLFAPEPQPERKRSRAPRAPVLDLDALFESGLTGRRGAPPAQRAPARPIPLPPRDKPLYTIDMATGVGMLALAFQLEGFRLGELCELDADKLTVAHYNLTSAVGAFAADLPGRTLPERYSDIRTAKPEGMIGCDARAWRPHVPRGGIDLFVGGPPCQPYSRLGAGRGAEDPRDLFERIPAICARAKPTVVVMENVEGTEGHPTYFRRWWRKMAEVGYEGVTYLLLAADYGSAQRRARAFFVAWRRGFEGAGRLRRPPPPTNHAPPWLRESKEGREAASRGMLGRGVGASLWVSGAERVTGGCCYGLWSCNWLNNTNNKCYGCFKGDNYLEAPAARDPAYPPGPKVRYFRGSEGWYARTRWRDPGQMARGLRYVPDAVWLDPEARAKAEAKARRTSGAWRALAGRLAGSERVVESWWLLTGRGARLVDRPGSPRRAKASAVPDRDLRHLLDAVYPRRLAGAGARLHALPKATVARRRVQFRLRPLTIRKAKVLDRARRMPPELTSYLAPTLLAGFFRSMVGAVYATTDEGDDGIESLRSATVHEHKALMDLPVWFVEGVSEATEGPLFLALGNGVPLNLGRAVARHVWRAFGREPLPEPERVGLWPTRSYHGEYPWCDEGVLSQWSPEGVFEVGMQYQYGSQDSY